MNDAEQADEFAGATPGPLIQDLRKLLAQATPAPWAAEECGEKHSCIMIGTVTDETDRRLSGFVDTYAENGDTKDGWLFDIIADLESHNAEGSARADAELILWLRNNADTLLAENAALKAQVEGLIEDRARFPDRPDFIGNMIAAQFGNLREAKKQADAHAIKAMTDRHVIAQDRDRLAAELEAAREALEFYANPPKDERVPDFYDELSFGDRARAALSPAESPEPQQGGE